MTKSHIIHFSRNNYCSVSCLDIISSGLHSRENCNTIRIRYRNACTAMSDKDTNNFYWRHHSHWKHINNSTKLKGNAAVSREGRACRRAGRHFVTQKLAGKLRKRHFYVPQSLINSHVIYANDQTRRIAAETLKNKTTKLFGNARNDFESEVRNEGDFIAGPKVFSLMCLLNSLRLSVRIYLGTSGGFFKFWT